MMPEGLLNTLKRDEVLDLMAYLLSRGDRKSAMFTSREPAGLGSAKNARPCDSSHSHAVTRCMAVQIRSTEMR